MIRLDNFVSRNVQKASEYRSFWKLANRNKGSRKTDNSPIQGRDGVIFDARGKATAVAECLENQFTPMRPTLLSGLITDRSGEGCNYFVILASMVALIQWAATK